jgi:phospholipase C
VARRSVVRNVTQHLNRRTFLKVGAATAGVAATSYGLPAWARPLASAATGLRRPDTLPFPHRRAGTPDPALDDIDHVIVLMMENHSFDNILGMVPHQVPGRSHVDGLTVRRGHVANWNPDVNGKRVYGSLAPSPCQNGKGQGAANAQAVGQDWDLSHEQYNGGQNNGFVKACGPTTMWHWDESFLPFTYSLAGSFPMGERYFCSLLGQTDPNRRFLWTATSSGYVNDDADMYSVKPVNGSIFDRLEHHGISWADYYFSTGGPSIALVPGILNPARAKRNLFQIDQFYADAASGHLRSYTFLEPDYGKGDEENPQDVQVGEEFIENVVRAVMHSPKWDRTALFITYDEHGGYYDHVPPPRAIAPDSTPVITSSDDESGGVPLVSGAFNRYGFRVPLFVISPWAKAGYVSQIVQDHTSIDAFIERKWNLPAMTYRDANAHPMTDYFDFTAPAFRDPPRLASAPTLTKGLAECTRLGYTPPLP